MADIKNQEQQRTTFPQVAKPDRIYWCKKQVENLNLGTFKNQEKQRIPFIQQTLQKLDGNPGINTEPKRAEVRNSGRQGYKSHELLGGLEYRPEPELKIQT